MKKVIFLLGLMTLLTTACSKDDTPIKTDIVALDITLAGSNGTKAVGTPTQTDENVIKNFTVYVYENNILVKTKAFTSATTGSIDSLTVGAKQIVVIANVPATFPTIALGSNYSDLASTANYVQLGDQKDVTNGLVMTGETSKTLVAGAANQVSIPVTRLVAKIMLGTITVTPDPGYDAGLLTLTGVAMIKVKSQSSVGIPSITTADPLFSGIAGPIVTATNVVPYLFETISLADHSNRYFYVFANDNANNDATLMTLEGTYDGNPVYYPFVIDMPVGNYILRNTSHLVNITLKKLGAGSPDPETPLDFTTLDVTITPVDWVVEPVQVEEW